MKIGIDVDGVLRDFCGGLINVIQKHYPQYLKKHPNYGPPYSIYNNSGEPNTIIKDWQLEKNFNCSKRDLQEIFWYDYAQDIMGRGAPIKGAVPIMRDLLDKSEHEYWCITSQKDHARHLTLKWLGDMQLNFDRVVFVKGRDKWKVEVDWLVDDSPENWHAWKRWRKGTDSVNNYILVNTIYNRHIKSHYRINDLSEVIGIINDER